MATAALHSESSPSFWRGASEVTASPQNGNGNPVRVVHMTSVHSALDGRIFRKECRSLQRAGYDVTIVGPYREDTVADNVRIRSVQRDERRLARMTRTVWRVYNEARKQNADVYHFHDPELIPIGLLLRAKGKRVIYDIHEDMPKDIMSKHYLPIWSRRMVAWVAERIENTTCGQFSALVAVTPSIANRFLPMNENTIIVHNYPFLEELLAESRDQFSWESRRHSMAYVGGITAQRAIREMVHSMALLPESLPATLELAGNEIPKDAHPEELYRHAGWKRVKHHGILDQFATFRLLHNVRGGLVLFHPEPNHCEAMPQKIFEYMGAGLPIIGSDFPLWRRLLGDAGCAILVDPKDPAAIARSIEYLLTHPKEAEQMGRRGRALVLDQYNWNSQAEKLLNLYSGLTNPKCAV
jgi:glycosyltransferase involved in cell wall biosynthesis